jgi:hypothetical protein
VLIGLIGGSAFAGASVRPDLAETVVSVSQHRGALRVTDVVRNLSTMAAPSSATGYYLAHRRIGGRSVGSLRPRAVSRGSKRLAVPGSVKPGSYQLLACADGRNRIRESDERNNCRSASQSVKVSDRTPPRFAGLTRATTCIPGPVGGETRSSRHYLQWEAAVDTLTPRARSSMTSTRRTRPARKGSLRRHTRRWPARPRSGRRCCQTTVPTTSLSAPGTRPATATRTRSSSSA